MTGKNFKKSLWFGSVTFAMLGCLITGCAKVFGAEITVEAEQFEGVKESDNWSHYSPWTKAVGAGVDGLKQSASGGDYVFAGSGTFFEDGRDTRVFKRVPIPAAGWYDVLVRVYDDGTDRGFILAVYEDWIELVKGKLCQGGGKGKGLGWKKVGTWRLSKEVVIELIKDENSEDIAVCDAISLRSRDAPIDVEAESFNGVIKEPTDEVSGPWRDAAIAGGGQGGGILSWASFPSGGNFIYGGKAVSSVSKVVPVPSPGEYDISIRLVDAGQGTPLSVTLSEDGKVLAKEEPIKDGVGSDNVWVWKEIGRVKLRKSIKIELAINETSETVVCDCVRIDRVVHLPPDTKIMREKKDQESHIESPEELTSGAPQEMSTELEVTIPPDDRIMKLRYPKAKIRRDRPRLSVHEKGDSIIISGELTTLEFSKKTCSISRATIRDSELNPVSLPDCLIVDEEGREFWQRKAVDGNLSYSWSEDRNYFELRGSCTPRAETALKSTLTLNLHYRIHGELGIILVYAKVGKLRGKEIKVRELSFVNRFGDKPSYRVDKLKLVQQWDPARIEQKDRFGFDRHGVCKEIVSREDGVICAEHYTSATWTNGRIGFHVQPVSFDGVSIDPEYEKDPKARKYVTVGTREGQRTVDMVYVRRSPGSEVKIRKDTTYSFAVSLLPFRKYRPRFEIFGCTNWSHETVPSEWTVMDLARAGVTATYAGWGAVTEFQCEPQERVRLLNTINLCHRYGIKANVGIVSKALESTVVEHGFFSREQFERAHILLPWAEGEQPMCFNDENYRNRFLKFIFGLLDEYGGDGVQIDLMQLEPCANPVHGCSPDGTLPVTGNLDFFQKFRDHLKQTEDEAKYIMPHCGERFDYSQALADFTIPGEMFLSPNFFNAVEHDLVYSSLLYGTQIIYYTGNGGITYNSPWIYEKALSRCALVSIGFVAPTVAPNECFSPEEQRLFEKYMMPLGIFDIEDSIVHHPFDSDFKNYCVTDNRDVTPVIYSRKGDILLVITRENESIPKASLTLDLKRLGIAEEEVLLYDTIASRLMVARAEGGGRLSLRNISLKQGPGIFRIRGKSAFPEVIWHDRVIWRIISSSHPSAKETKIQVAGVPESAGRLVFYCGDNGKPARVNGGELISYDEESRLAEIKIDIPIDATGEVHVFFE